MGFYGVIGIDEERAAAAAAAAVDDADRR